MAKELFKVGDKVKPKAPELWAQGNNIGTVRKLLPRKLLTSDVTVDCWVNGKSITTIYSPEEIKHVCQKGQMLFDFML